MIIQNPTLFFHGVRGSYPQSGAQFLLGGHTVCTEYSFITKDRHSFLFDAGTGTARFSPFLRDYINDHAKRKVNSLSSSKYRIYLFLSHYHLDHVMGLTLLDSLFHQDFECIVYGPRLPSVKGVITAKDIFQKLIQPPLYPFEFNLFQHKIIFHDFNIGDNLFVEGHTLQTIGLNHPGQNCGYRVSIPTANKTLSFCYITDVGLAPSQVEYPSSLSNFVKNTDLLIQDAYFNDDDFQKFRHFGHGNCRDVARFAQKSNVQDLALYHHNPSYTDDVLTRLENDAKVLFPRTFLATEGQSFPLG